MQMYLYVCYKMHFDVTITRRKISRQEIRCAVPLRFQSGY